jgi:response regulator NasT
MLSSSLSVLVIDENRIRASIIEEGLQEAGCTRVRVVSEIIGLPELVGEINPDVIFIDLENPNRDALEYMLQVSRAGQRPVAMFVDRSDTAMTEAAIEAGVSAYVVDGLKKERVKPILDMAVSRFNAFSRLRDELARTKQALEERKAIDRAKGILMDVRGLSEDEAYALLRRMAMNENRRISEIAQSIIIAAKAFSRNSP